MDYTTQKASFILGGRLWKSAVNTVLSVSDWDVLFLTCRCDKVKKPEGLSIKQRTNPRRNPVIALCSPGAFLIWRKWIIHKRRGLVPVVNSIGVSPLSVAGVIFSPSVTDRQRAESSTTVPLTFHLLISFTSTWIPDFSIFLLHSFATVTDSLPSLIEAFYFGIHVRCF